MLSQFALRSVHGKTSLSVVALSACTGSFEGIVFYDDQVTHGY
jgi:hypothetical protein